MGRNIRAEESRAKMVLGRRVPEPYQVCKAGFLFSILGIGAGPSELGKSAHEIWKLGKIVRC